MAISNNNFSKPGDSPGSADGWAFESESFMLEMAAIDVSIQTDVDLGFTEQELLFPLVVGHSGSMIAVPTEVTAELLFPMVVGHASEPYIPEGLYDASYGSGTETFEALWGAPLGRYRLSGKPWLPITVITNLYNSGTSSVETTIDVPATPDVYGYYLSSLAFQLDATQPREIKEDSWIDVHYRTELEGSATDRVNIPAGVYDRNTCFYMRPLGPNVGFIDIYDINYSATTVDGLLYFKATASLHVRNMNESGLLELNNPDIDYITYDNVTYEAFEAGWSNDAGLTDNWALIFNETLDGETFDRFWNPLGRALSNEYVQRQLIGTLHLSAPANGVTYNINKPYVLQFKVGEDGTSGYLGVTVPAGAYTVSAMEALLNTGFQTAVDADIGAFTSSNITVYQPYGTNHLAIEVDGYIEANETFGHFITAPGDGWSIFGVTEEIFVPSEDQVTEAFDDGGFESNWYDNQDAIYEHDDLVFVVIGGGYYEGFETSWTQTL